MCLKGITGDDDDDDDDNIQERLECSNYRAITLLNVTYIVLSGILYNRLTV